MLIFQAGEDRDGERGVGDANVQAHVEEVIFVFEQAQFEVGVAFTAANFTDLVHAGLENEDLNGSEEHKDDGAEDDVGFHVGFVIWFVSVGGF